MSFIFKDAFPTLKLKNKASVLLEDTIVTKVTTPKNHDFLNVYIESDHIITKDVIREVEREIGNQVINNTRTKVRVFESFKLQTVPTLEKVYEEYEDSALVEIEADSILFFNMIRTAKVSFESPDKMIISLGDIPVYHAKEQELADLLNEIYIKRFGTNGSIEFTYHEVKIEQKEDDPEFLRVIKSATENAYRTEEKFLGATGSSGNDKSTKDTGSAPADVVATSSGSQSAKPKESAPEKPKSQGSSGGFKGGYGGGFKGGYRNQAPKMNDPNAIYGSVFPDEKTVPLNELNEGMGNVSVKGMVFSIKAIDIKDGRSIISFNIADFTDAISCRIYVDTAESATY